MGMEDDDHCTADYGAFGNNACNCSVCKPPVSKPMTATDKMIAERQQARREHEREVSSAFNSHMIHLYNQTRQP